MFAPTIRHIEENREFLNDLHHQLGEFANRLSAIKVKAKAEGRNINIQETQIRERILKTQETLEKVDPDVDPHLDSRVADIKKNLKDIESQLAYLYDSGPDSLENHSQKTYYIANVIHAVKVDNVFNNFERELVDSIVKEINASEQERQDAEGLVDSGNYFLHRVGSFADQMRNLEDMIRACFSDGVYHSKQKELIEDFAGSIGVDQGRMDLIQNWLGERIQFIG